MKLIDSVDRVKLNLVYHSGQYSYIFAGSVVIIVDAMAIDHPRRRMVLMVDRARSPKLSACHT